MGCNCNSKFEELEIQKTEKNSNKDFQSINNKEQIKNNQKKIII